MDVDAGAAQSADDQLAKKLVRYAISCEYSRTPIRRDGIKEKGTDRQESTRPGDRDQWLTGANAVLGDRGRSFRRIFALAQKQLRLVWGMELRELSVREKMTLHEKRKGTCKHATRVVRRHSMLTRGVHNSNELKFTT